MSDLSMQQIRERIDRQRSQLYLILMQPTEHYDTASEQGTELMRRHLQWQLELQDRGISLGAGPFGDLGSAQTQQQFQQGVAPHDDMLNASGMYIIAAASRDAAEALARTEPFEAGGWRRHTVVVWNMNEGAAWQLAQQMVDAAASPTPSGSRGAD